MLEVFTKWLKSKYAFIVQNAGRSRNRHVHRKSTAQLKIMRWLSSRTRGIIGNECICGKLEVAPICDKMRKGQLRMVSTSATKTNECTSKEQYDPTRSCCMFLILFCSSTDFNEIVSDQIIWLNLKEREKGKADKDVVWYNEKRLNDPLC